MAEAVSAAAGADAAVVVVGTTDEWETEGEDRTTIAFAGLVEREFGSYVKVVGA